MRKRLLTAGGIVVALVVGTLFVDACLQKGNFNSGGGTDIVFDGAVFESASSDEGGLEALPLGFLEAIAGSGWSPAGYAGVLPPGFASEVTGQDGFEEAFFAESGSVVGFIGSGTGKETFARVSDELIGKGWVRIESNQDLMGSFVKEGGAYTWVMVSCTEAGDKVGTVIQFQKGRDHE